MIKSLVLAGFCLFFATSLVLAGTWNDDFEDAAFTQKAWEIKQGDWEIKDGWWEAFSPSTGKGCFAILPEIETHDGLTMEVTEKDMGGGWQNGYIIFAYVSDTEIYYAGARIGRGKWSIEKSALAGGEQNFGDIPDGRIKAGGVVIPRYKVAIEGKDVVIYTDGNKEQVRASFPKMPVGRVGLANENTTTRFDDFVASGPKVKSGGKFALEPAGNLVTCWGNIKAR